MVIRGHLIRHRQDEREVLLVEVGALENRLRRHRDLVIGVDKFFKHLDVELDLGYFLPGEAFSDDEDDPAWWVQLQFEWNF